MPAHRWPEGDFFFGGSLFGPSSCEPQAFIAGDTVAWVKSCRDYSSLDDWTLQYRAVNPADNDEIAAADFVITPDGVGGWMITLPASASSERVAGDWQLVGWVSKTGQRKVVYDAPLTLNADVTVVTAKDLQSENEQILAALEARLKGRATADQESVQVNGTSLTRIPMEKLAMLVGIYKSKVWRERNPGQSNPRHVMRFTRAH